MLNRYFEDHKYNNGCDMDGTQISGFYISDYLDMDDDVLNVGLLLDLFPCDVVHVSFILYEFDIYYNFSLKGMLFRFSRIPLL